MVQIALTRGSGNMTEKEGYVYQYRKELVAIKIPDGAIKCPHCDGYGEMKICVWDATPCVYCESLGYMTKERQEFFKRLQAENEVVKK